MYLLRVSRHHCIWVSVWCFVFSALAVDLAVSGDLKLAEVAGNAPAEYLVGTGKVDITPTHPVLLNGYGARPHQLTLDVVQKLYARSVAIGRDSESPAVLIAVDNLGISADIHRAVSKALEAKYGILRSKLAINASHTHSAPMLTGVANPITARELTEREQAAMDGYTKELTAKLVQVAEAAIDNRTTCRLDWGTSSVGFAINRRGAKIVDHSLPILRAVDRQGKVQALITKYACHCVSAPGDLNMCGDWAGYAAEELESDFPGATALVLIGCGADQNPRKMDSIDASKSQGHMLVAAAESFPGQKLTPISGQLNCQFADIELPLTKALTKEEWEAQSKKKGFAGFIASKNLARLERGEPIPHSVIYPIQTWTFGDDLAIVFLAGEVVVDYSRLIADRFEGSKLWVCGYSNDAPCYIPSERVLREGGYEGADAMAIYDKPRPFATGLEKKILDEVSRQLADFGKASMARTGGTHPLSPESSVAQMRVPDHLQVQIVAAEPLVVDPVAIDFGHDGKLWIAEMHDYPEGLDGHFKPGGRVKFLEDTDSDGVYDKATTLLDGVPFPTGVKAWRKGVLVCAAPNVIYAEDTNGDGKADVQREVLSGFSTENYQARVNSLTLGLDNWIYGAAGGFGGTLHTPNGKPVDANNRDFRFQPETSKVEAVSGRTQQGRARDDWGNWFGCDSGTLAFHYPLTEHYYSRNREVASPEPSLRIAASNQLFPLGKIVKWKLSGPPGLPTSTCGLGIYRDNLLGDDFANNAFICESVNQLVHRMQLLPQGVTFSAQRPASEADHEFLASTDNWFRPVQALTGPDGGLYIVDMYRYLIEHPRWLTAEARASTEVRAGDTMGRIYRVVPKSQELRTVPKLATLSTLEVVSALDSPNGALRDMAHIELLWRADDAAIKPLTELAISAVSPQVRVQALCALDGLTTPAPDVVLAALNDSHAAVRRHAIRISERVAPQSPPIGDRLTALAADDDPQVRLQLAYSLGELDDGRAGAQLVKLLRAAADDPYTKSAALSSLTANNIGAALAEFFEKSEPASSDIALRLQLIELAAKLGNTDSLSVVAGKLFEPEDETFSTWQLQATPVYLRTIAGRSISLNDGDAKRWESMLSAARTLTKDEHADEVRRLAAMTLLSYSKNNADIELLIAQLSPQMPLGLQQAAIRTLAAIESPLALAGLFDAFPRLTPSAQATLLDESLAHERLATELLARIATERLPRAAVDPVRRQALLNHPQREIRRRAENLFTTETSAEIGALLKKFAAVEIENGDASAGRLVFQKHCAACHRVDDLGHLVGPDIAALTDKSIKSLITSIVDPNAAVDGRYLSYTAVTTGGEVFTGILASESVNSIVLKAADGKEQVLLRKALESDGLKNTGKSLMPDGLAREISPSDMQNLLTFLARGSVREHSKFESVNVLQKYTASVKGNAEEEQRRIPAIWKVALEAGKRNDADEIRDILDLALPDGKSPLSLWQAVAVGGGVVNGISQAGAWPKARIDEILQNDASCKARWLRSLELAAPLADDEKVSPGFRYDALRLAALRSFDVAGPQLARYVSKDAHHELRLGAVSGLADVSAPEAAEMLISACDHLNSELRALALQGILKTPAGARQLLTAIETHKLASEIASREIREKLLAYDNPEIQEQARRLFAK